ncbi:MAG: hypothetical protein ACK4IS_09320 [Erythrobacter sp.]
MKMGFEPHLGKSGNTTERLTRSIAESRDVFSHVIWPLWSTSLNSKQLLSTEASEACLEREADFSGTDGFFVRKETGILIPIASRIEYFDKVRNNPFVRKYWDHYPRFTTRIAKRRRDGSLNFDVECQKRIAALDDDISKRYLPLYTFQSLVIREEIGYSVIQSSVVETESLFHYVRERNLFDISRGLPSYTKREKDIYRIVTVEKLRRAGIPVKVIDRRPHLAP